MRVIIVILIVTAFFQAKCQVPIGQWRTHLPYSSAINVEYAGDKIGEMIIKKITAEVKIICDYDLLSKAYEFSVGQKEFDDTLLDAVIERAKELFVFQNLDSKEDTSLFKAVIDDYMQELDIEGKSIEELEFSDPSLLLDEVSGYSTQALLKTLVAKFPKLDFFSDN